MSMIEIFVFAVCLSLDAFAVSVCKGIASKKITLKNSFLAGFYFGLFQALMPTLGFFLGKNFATYLKKFDYWIVFFLLFFIGFSMAKESFENKDGNDSFDAKTMIPLAFATSIDAFSAGITFSLLHLNLALTNIFIGVTTFFFSFFGVQLGKIFGKKLGNKAEFVGGIVLILFGVKIFLQGFLKAKMY